jgi:RNA polymerase sigma factor (sigma-70 family)
LREATFRPGRSFWNVDIADTRVPPGAAASVTALYAEHALGLVRLAVVVTGDRGAAEDIVQDAFLGLYRRWDQLPDMAAPLAYLRVSVMNGCRTALRRRSRLSLGPGPGAGDGLDEAAAGFGTSAGLSESAEARVLLAEEQRAVASALRRLPRRQLEAVVLRYYLDLSVEETAQVMGISPGTVKSATSRALAAVGRTLKEGS